MTEEEKILEVMVDAICDAIDADASVRPQAAARAALTALQDAGWVVVRKGHGVSHKREPFEGK